MSLLIFVILLTTGCDVFSDAPRPLDINEWRSWRFLSVLWYGVVVVAGITYLLRKQSKGALHQLVTDEGTLPYNAQGFENKGQVMRQTINDSSNDSSAEDTYLATQTKAGNEAAFRKLFDKHYKWVYNKAYGMLKNHQDSEETSQDVFVKVWEKLRLGKWDPDQGSFQAWLNTVARNTIIDAIRKRDQILEQPLSGSPDEDEQPFELDQYADPRPGPEHEVETAEAQLILESALEKVTKPNHRIAWILRHFENYPIKEIARILNRTESTVKVWIFRCTEELQKIILAKGTDWML